MNEHINQNNAPETPASGGGAPRGPENVHIPASRDGLEN